MLGEKPFTMAGNTRGIFCTQQNTRLKDRLIEVFKAGVESVTVRFSPPNDKDTISIGGANRTVDTRYQCITAMKEYESKSLEELRFEDYTMYKEADQWASGMAAQALTDFAGFGNTGTTGYLFANPFTQKVSKFGSSATSSQNTFKQSTGVLRTNSTFSSMAVCTASKIIDSAEDVLMKELTPFEETTRISFDMNTAQRSALKFLKEAGELSANTKAEHKEPVIPAEFNFLAASAEQSKPALASGFSLGKVSPKSQSETRKPVGELRRRHLGNAPSSNVNSQHGMFQFKGPDSENSKGQKPKSIQTDPRSEMGSLNLALLNIKKKEDERGVNGKKDNEERKEAGLDKLESIRNELYGEESFCIQGEQIKEQNKKKRELLTTALMEREKHTDQDESWQTEIQKELDELDELLTIDVSILKEQAEQASLEYQESQRCYEQAEMAYLEAKATMQEKSDLKRSTKQHVDLFIQQNEVWKACKLTELMKKLSVKEGNDLTDIGVVDSGPNCKSHLKVTDSAIGKEVTNSATDKEMTGSATDKEVTGSATDKEVTGSATDKEMTGSATDKEVTNSATDKEVTSSATDSKPLFTTRPLFGGFTFMGK